MRPFDATNTGAFSTQEQKVIFKMIEEGGQIFPPKDSCHIQITSAYTGKENGILDGTVPDCRVRSAGIEHTVSAKFSMKGIPRRTL